MTTVSAIVLKICILAIVLFMFLLGIFKFFAYKNTSTCEMTYMYQTPQFIKIELSKQHLINFPKYKLFIYGEGYYAEVLNQGKFYGIPVLFIHGNSGSYKQVRSLASVALTKANSNRSPFHFNYYSIDFDEELSAYFGGVLAKQTEFVAICVKKILSLYKEQQNRPISLILVGHSMGGLIARALFTLPGFDPSFVNVIITLGAPHFHSKPDLYVADFYASVNSYWVLHRNDTLKHLNLLSIGGGRHDVVVRSDLVRIPTISSSTKDLTVVSTAVPSIWTSMDHLCIVWCNQMVLTTVRATFKLVDKTSGQIIVDSDKRAKILEDFFISGTGMVTSQDVNAGSELPIVEPTWTKSSSNSVLRHYSLPALNSVSALLTFAGQAVDEMVVMSLGSDHRKPDMISCKLKEVETNNVSTVVCEVTKKILCASQYIPQSLSSRQHIFRCSRSSLKGENHVAFVSPASKNSKEVYIDAFDISERSWNVTFLELLATILIRIPKQTVFARIVFPDLVDSWQAYKATINISGLHCPGTSNFHVPWSIEDTFMTIQNNETVHIMHLFTPKAYDDTASNDAFPELRLYLHPNCNYTVAIEFSLFDALEQVVRFNLYYLPIFFAASLLQILANQFFSLSDTGVCHSPWRSFSIWSVFRDIVIAHLIAAILRWSSIFCPKDYMWLLPVPSLKWTQTGSPLVSAEIIALCYVVSGGMLCLMSALVSMVVIPAAKIFAAVMNWLKFVKPSGESSSTLTSTLINIIFCVSFLLIGGKTCGAVALLALQVIAALKLFYAFVVWYRHEPSAEEARINAQERHRRNANRCQLSLSLYLLWGMVLQFNCPALIFWIKDLNFKQHLSPDPTFLPAVFMILARLCQGSEENMRKRSYWWLAVLQRIFSVIVIVFYLEHIYKASWLLAIDALILAAWSTFTNLLFKDAVTIMSTAVHKMTNTEFAEDKVLQSERSRTAKTTAVTASKM